MAKKFYSNRDTKQSKNNKKGTNVKRVVLILMGLSSLTWSEFTAKGGVIKDSNTQLEWQNRDIKILDWESANRYCRNYN